MYPDYRDKYPPCQPFITIVTVTYNAEHEIERTLQSVAEQSYGNFEHLIIDGASTDRTLETVKCFPDNGRIRVISKPDNGIYHGMNRGLKYAKGEYVLFLNAGDKFASKNSLQALADKAKKGTDIIYGDTLIVDDDGKILRMRHLTSPDTLTVDSFSKGMLVCHQAFMVRREIAPQYSKEYRFSADYDWCIRCMKATSPARCVNLYKVVIHYLDNGATEKHKLESLRERFAIMRTHYGLFSTILRHISFIPRALLRHL